MNPEEGMSIKDYWRRVVNGGITLTSKSVTPPLPAATATAIDIIMG